MEPAGCSWASHHIYINSTLPDGTLGGYATQLARCAYPALSTDEQTDISGELGTTSHVT